MASTVNLGSVKPVSEHDENKVASINGVLDEYDANMAGLVTVTVTTADVTLTRAQALNAVIKVTGTLTGNRVLFIPHTGGANRAFILWNATAGAFTLTVKTTAGGSTGIAVTQAKKQLLFHDGTHVLAAEALDTSAWGAWTPTVSSYTGTITTASAAGFYKQVGKTVFFRFRATITTNGTGGTGVLVTLPAAAMSGGHAFPGRENGVSSKTLGATLFPDTSTLYISNYDGTYPGADGALIDFEGVYECA